jgi:tetratricopeptide (TPR) repeat protein
MYAWTLIQMGQFNKAAPHAKKAYELDSFTSNYVATLAHSHLHLKNFNEARRLYMKWLTLIETPSGFEEGILEDFNIFIEGGWEVEYVTLEMTHLTNEWNAHFKYKTIGNEYFVKGQALEKKKKFASAGLAFDTAIANEQKGRTVRFGLFRNYYRWAAYNYYKEADYETSLERYAKAWDINLTHLNDPELEMVDLKSIRNVNDWLDNDAMENMYDKMKFAVQRKLQSKQQSNDLYFISIGTNGSGYRHAANDAEVIANVVKERAQRIFDNSFLYVLNQDKSGSVSDAFNKVIAASKPGDCFMLYYTGYTTEDNFVMGTDTINNEQILAWLSSMSASKKLPLIDAVGSSLIGPYAIAHKNDKQDNIAGSIGFLISDGRVEMPTSTGSVFTSYLTSGIEGLAATNWKNDFHKDTTATIAYVTSKSLEGYMYGNMPTGNLQFDLKSYSTGVDFPLTFVNASTNSIDTIPPMIYLPSVIGSEEKRGGKTKIVTISKNVGGHALDESGIEEITVNGFPVTFTQNGKFNLD